MKHVQGDFCQILSQLNDQDARLISARDEAYIRIKTAGKVDIGKSSGTWCLHGVEYKPFNHYPLLRRESRLLDPKLASQAVDANRNNKYFSTNSTKEYEESLAIAKEDRNKAPKERRIIILPPLTRVTISPRQSSEILEFLLQDLAEEYYKFNGSKSIILYLINSETINQYKGTVLTQFWFWDRNNNSDFDGSRRILNCNCFSRG
jgi:hypothetical protein